MNVSDAQMPSPSPHRSKPQLRIDSCFSFERRFAKIGSARLAHAVSAAAGAPFSAEDRACEGEAAALDGGSGMTAVAASSDLAIRKRSLPKRQAQSRVAGGSRASGSAKRGRRRK